MASLQLVYMMINKLCHVHHQHKGHLLHRKKQSHENEEQQLEAEVHELKTFLGMCSCSTNHRAAQCQ